MGPDVAGTGFFRYILAIARTPDITTPGNCREVIRSRIIAGSSGTLNFGEGFLLPAGTGSPHP
jgi:hypothetical protein